MAYLDLGGTTPSKKKKRTEQPIVVPKPVGAITTAPVASPTPTQSGTIQPYSQVYPDMKVDPSKIVSAADRGTSTAAQQLGAAVMGSAMAKGWTSPDSIASVAAKAGETNPLASGQMAQAPTPQPPSGAPGASVSQPTTQAPTFDMRGAAERVAEAVARAKQQIDLRREGLRSEAAQLAQIAERQRKEQLTNLAQMEERNRYQFAGRNLGSSGFMAGANAVAQGQTQGNIGRIDEDEMTRRQAIADQLAGLDRLQGDVTTATLAELERGDFDRALRAADQASLLARRDFDLNRDRALLPGQLTAQEYGLESARLGNLSGIAEYNDRYSPTGLGYLERVAAYNDRYSPEGITNQLNALKLREATLANEIANNPDYGVRAQAMAEMERVQADIARLNRSNTGGSEGFTPWQQYQMIRDEMSDETRAAEQTAKEMAARVKPFTDVYNVTSKAAEVWTDYNDIINAESMSDAQKWQMLQQMMQSMGIDNYDQGWLNLMFAAGRGDQGAQNAINTKYRKKPIEE